MSNLNDIISRGKDLPKYDFTFWSNFNVWGYILSAIMLLILIGAVSSLISDSEYGASFMFTIVFSAICLIILSFCYLRSGHNADYEKWESAAYQFINNLPVEEYEIIYIKIDPEMASNSSGVFFLGSGTISSRIEKATPVTVAYKIEDEILVKTFWAITNMKLSESDEPYLSFQNLPKSLGNGIEKGWYNPVVHLPRNYEFTDIK